MYVLLFFTLMKVIVALNSSNSNARYINFSCAYAND